MKRKLNPPPRPLPRPPPLPPPLLLGVCLYPPHHWLADKHSIVMRLVMYLLGGGFYDSTLSLRELLDGDLYNNYARPRPPYAPRLTPDH